MIVCHVQHSSWYFSGKDGEGWRNEYKSPECRQLRPSGAPLLLGERSCPTTAVCVFVQSARGWYRCPLLKGENLPNNFFIWLISGVPCSQGWLWCSPMCARHPSQLLPTIVFLKKCQHGINIQIYQNLLLFSQKLFVSVKFHGRCYVCTSEMRWNERDIWQMMGNGLFEVLYVMPLGWMHL